MTLATFLTNATCGESCWSAADDICRCSCGGKNHGCLRDETGARPVRSSRIDGCMYHLRAVGSTRELWAEAEAINRAVGPRSTSGGYTYYWSETEHGAPARIKPATASQCEKWPELSAYRGQDRWDRYRNTPYLLWARLEVQP